VTVVHPHVVFVHGVSPVHRLPGREKLVALLVFIVAVVATPAHQVWAFAAYGAVVAIAGSLARLSPGLVSRRLSVGLPFLLFAFALPFVGGGERVQMGSLSLSVAGAWAAWAILAKGVLCLGASVILTATTPVSEILRGLSALRVPGVLVGIAGFMVRYLDIIVSEARRMRVAMLARGHRSRWIWHARPVAGSAGLLFVRAHERGERVLDAMTARGYGGGIPEALGESSAPARWLETEALPVLACLVCIGALVVERGVL